MCESSWRARHNEGFPGVCRRQTTIKTHTGISVAATRIVRDDETVGPTPTSPTNKDILKVTKALEDILGETLKFDEMFHY